MRKAFLFLFTIIIFNISQAQDSYKESVKEKKERIENEEKELFFDLYNSVNELQSHRKQHYDNRFDKEYLSRYKNRRDRMDWYKDLERIDRFLYEEISLYKENYSRIKDKYPWVKQYPYDLISYFDIENIKFR